MMLEDKYGSFSDLSASPACAKSKIAGDPDAAHLLTIVLKNRYIGLALAMASSLGIGTSFVITKKVRFFLTGAGTACIRPLFAIVVITE